MDGIQKYPRLGPFRAPMTLVAAFNKLCVLWECSPSEAFRQCVRMALAQEYIKEDRNEESEGQGWQEGC